MAATLVSFGGRFVGALNVRATSTPRAKAGAPISRASSGAVLSSRPFVSSPTVAGPGRSWTVCMASTESMVDLIDTKNKENPLMVYSKTYCPFCTEVKMLFNNLGVEATIVELDNLADGDAVQSALSSVSGVRTVPQVFIGGEFVGGCDDTMRANRSGKLQELLTNAGLVA